MSSKYYDRYGNTKFKSFLSLEDQLAQLESADSLLVQEVINTVIPAVKPGHGYRDFLESVIGQFRTRGKLSDAQREKLRAAVDRQRAYAAAPKPREPEPSEPTVSSAGVLNTQALLVKAREHKVWPSISLGDILLTLAGPTAKVPGSVNVLSSDRSTWFGRLHEGKFTWSRDVDQDRRNEIGDRIDAFGLDPAGVAAVEGREKGACCFCQQTLTDGRSLDVGYGPVCAANYGLPWG